MRDEEKKAEAEIKVKSGFLKWLDNYWYHYKWPTIAVAFVVVVLSVCLWQTATTSKYDMLVVYSGPVKLSQDQTAQFCEVLSHVMPEDYDGDGKKNASMNAYHVYSADQIKKIESETDEAGVHGQVDRYMNSSQNDLYNNYMMTGDASLCFLDPWLFESMSKEYFCPLSEIFGEEIPKGAVDGYGIRLGDTDLYRDYGILRKLPADTVICLQTQFLSESFLGRKENAERFEFEKKMFAAIIEYESINGAATDAATDGATE